VKLVSPILKRIVYPGLARAGYFRARGRSGLAVVTYHGVIPSGYPPVDSAFDGNLISRDVFRRQLQLLKANYTVISPEDVLAWCEQRRALPPRAVLITCDDGLLNNLTEMLPVLQGEGVKCLFFVTGASAGESRSTLWYEDLFLVCFRAPSGRFEISCGKLSISGDLLETEERRAIWWNAVKQLSQVDAEARNAFLEKIRLTLGVGITPDIHNFIAERRFGLLVRSELHALVAAGMTIGAHTLSHPMLSQCPAEIAWAEIAESRACLEAVLQTEVWALAYPFGDGESVTPQVMRMARDAGYKAAFMNFGGGLGAALPIHALPRIHVTAEMSLAELEANVAGFYAALQRKVRRSQRNEPETERE
jgi:peptidoglycan/xylan/chitin deacetylase (PgdA/CDA1 family)